ncbi:MAG TPA: hypothetical protein VHO70_07040 [Chitinispirillaceae bacterium]|nr:hypothetical protein [Chitinispirillaceae bacterium]
MQHCQMERGAKITPGDWSFDRVEDLWYQILEVVETEDDEVFVLGWAHETKESIPCGYDVITLNYEGQIPDSKEQDVNVWYFKQALEAKRFFDSLFE